MAGYLAGRFCNTLYNPNSITPLAFTVIHQPTKSNYLRMWNDYSRNNCILASGELVQRQPSRIPPSGVGAICHSPRDLSVHRHGQTITSYQNAISSFLPSSSDPSHDEALQSTDRRSRERVHRKKAGRKGEVARWSARTRRWKRNGHPSGHPNLSFRLSRNQFA